MIGKSVTVCGRVQGVFYRASTCDKASSLGLRGWVKNLPSGDVQIEAFGEESAVQELIAWCKHGPPMASVTSIKVEEIAFREEAPFRVVY
ncbi:MAG: acylphosphatase [Reichenbachiella sp.]|uniref:acylphosphatase n=1 Tax=Reichenbachiella sp. TaxID=2184521 RepID=UPI003267DDCD